MSTPATADHPDGSTPVTDGLRHDWQRSEIQALYELPLPELIWRAQSVHRQHFDPARVEVASLLSIKTGGCPEDCAYCPQSIHHDTGLTPEALVDLDRVRASAARARAAGATRFCMGAAWRHPSDRQVEQVIAMIDVVHELGMESCVTLGMLSSEQAERLGAAGLDYYNHNLDTSPEHYGNIITTRTYADRLDTLQHVRQAGIAVCCGGIIGMGESRSDRIGLLHALATQPRHPESVPINMLVQVAGTPLHGTPELEPLELVRTVAAARILMPASVVRLSAGRETMSDETQALCFLAGANSFFGGDRLLTTDNPTPPRDASLLDALGLTTGPLGVLAPGRSSRTAGVTTADAQATGDGTRPRA